MTLLNLYNAPRGSTDSGEGLKYLLSQSLPARPCLVAGDFNLHYPSCQTNATTSTGAEPFLQWADHQGMHLTLQPNTPTLPHVGTTPSILPGQQAPHLSRYPHRASARLPSPDRSHSPLHHNLLAPHQQCKTSAAPPNGHTTGRNFSLCHLQGSGGIGPTPTSPAMPLI